MATTQESCWRHRRLVESYELLCSEQNQNEPYKKKRQTPTCAEPMVYDNDYYNYMLDVTYVNWIKIT